MGETSSTATSTPGDVPIITTDPYALDVLADPLLLHEQVREAGPVVYLERYGVWAMARTSAGYRLGASVYDTTLGLPLGLRRIRESPFDWLCAQAY